MTIAAIIFAAGESLPAGVPRQPARRAGHNLLQRAAQAVLRSGCAPVVVVVGARIERMRGALQGWPLHVAVNGNWREGMGSSVRAGLQALAAIAPHAEAAILSVCDQALLTAAQFDALRDQYRKTGKPIVASAYAGSLGVPVLFDRSLFAELMELPAGANVKSLIAHHGRQCASVDFPGGEIDVDSDIGSEADPAFAAHPPAA